MIGVYKEQFDIFKIFDSCELVLDIFVETIVSKLFLCASI